MLLLAVHVLLSKMECIDLLVAQYEELSCLRMAVPQECVTCQSLPLLAQGLSGNLSVLINCFNESIIFHKQYLLKNRDGEEQTKYSNHEDLCE